MEYFAVIVAMAAPFALYGLFVLASYLRKRHEGRPKQAPVDDGDVLPGEAEETKRVAHIDRLAAKEAKQEAKEAKRDAKRKAKLEAKKARDEAKIARKSARASAHGHSGKAFSRAEPSLGDDVAAGQSDVEPSFESADQVSVVSVSDAEQTDFAEIEPQPVFLPESEQEELAGLPEAGHIAKELEPQQQIENAVDEAKPANEEIASQPQGQHQEERHGEDQASQLPSEPGAQEKETFPSLDPDVLNEYYYYVVRMSVPASMAGVTALQMATELIQKTKLERYQVLLGHNADSNRWEKPRPDKDYSHLVWAVPLCSRESNISKDEMGNTVRVIQDRMRKANGKASFPSHQDIEERLIEVDAFCDDVDHKMIVFLLAQKESGGQPQRNSDIIELAMHEKMEEVNGRIVRMVNGENWYVLDTGTGEPLGKKNPDRRLANLMLWMDVPHVSNVEAAFDEMFGVARKLARVLGFSLVNEDQQPIDDEMIDNARMFISQRCHYMLERGVRPGSKLARALFS